MQLFDGKQHAAKLDQYISDKLARDGEPSGEFLIVLVGDNPASLNYIGAKKRLLERFGIKVRFEQLSESLEDAQIITLIGSAFEDASVKGGLIQMPLPRPSLNRVKDLIPPHKDLDLISSINYARFTAGDFSYLPPVVGAFCYFLLTSYLGEAKGIEDYIKSDKAIALLKQTVGSGTGFLLGNGLLVGLPISQFLKNLNIKSIVNVNYDTSDPIEADFAVLGAGVPNLVSGKDIKAGCHVVDYGTAFLNGRIAGDLDRNSATDHLGCVAYSPGGIGPVVVRFLLMNFLGLHQANNPLFLLSKQSLSSIPVKRIT